MPPDSMSFDLRLEFGGSELCIAGHLKGYHGRTWCSICQLRAAHPDLLMQHCTFAGSNIKRVFRV